MLIPINHKLLPVKTNTYFGTLARNKSFFLISSSLGGLPGKSQSQGQSFIRSSSLKRRSVILKAFDLKSRETSSSSLGKSLTSKASLRAFTENKSNDSQKNWSVFQLARILDLNCMNEWHWDAALSEIDFLQKTIHEYALAIAFAFSFNFFFSEGKTQGMAKPLCLASCSRTCCLFSSLKSSRQYSKSDYKKLVYGFVSMKLNKPLGTELISSSFSRFSNTSCLSIASLNTKVFYDFFYLSDGSSAFILSIKNDFKLV